ncbi:MAG TPA: TetR/AcrR family transcriptional regulator [Beijerinckiaceae bacterium]|nr:TetR/AcrR family transcriptional regulator [Beijerinckiaceae bacterium]
MARLRAADYDDKRRALLDVAARLFATAGFDRTSISEIAGAAGVSKALLYHYYSGKDEVLFDIIHSHIQELVQQVEQADRRDLPPVDHLRGLIVATLEAYRDADTMHKVQINELSKLSDERQQVIRALERRLVTIMAGAILRINPALADVAESRLLKPVTMALFGVLNWTYLWFRDGKPLTREAYGDIVTKLFVDGVMRMVEADAKT